MEIRRTANAGILLKLDGVSILLDGVSQKVDPYLATPHDIKDRILSDPPDALVFTHSHPDHYDPDFVAQYKACKNGVIIGPKDISTCVYSEAVTVKNVTIKPIATRHIGKSDGCEHFSYMICGSKRILFAGDASPLLWRQEQFLYTPDVVVVPFAYATSDAAWERTKTFCGKNVVIIHLPEKNDPVGLWDAVDSVISKENQTNIWIPEMGESIRFD